MTFSDAGYALSLAVLSLFILHLASAKEVRRKEHKELQAKSLCAPRNRFPDDIKLAFRPNNPYMRAIPHAEPVLISMRQPRWPAGPVHCSAEA